MTTNTPEPYYQSQATQYGNYQVQPQAPGGNLFKIVNTCTGQLMHNYLQRRQAHKLAGNAAWTDFLRRWQAEGSNWTDSTTTLATLTTHRK